ncbi:Leucine-rich repeat domain superfamily [Sesbania bispinosa]|nr:Leucine-rich repeat domain superfamily [Sesbania bispinosa]
MISIASLVLSNNPLGRSIPKTIGKLKELDDLHLDDCLLSGKILAKLGDVETEAKIHLSKSMLIGNITEKVLNLDKLEEFDVSRNRLKGRIPTHKAKIPTRVMGWTKRHYSDKE